MKDIYIIRVDHHCLVCGLHNKIETVVETPVDFIACAGCGAYIKAPKDLKENDKKAIDMIVADAIERNQDVIL